MAKKTNHPLTDKTDLRFKLFHELMSHKVHEVLLVSTPYDAWIMEEDCRLSEAINNEYKGLHLSNPPRLNWVSSINAALAALKGKDYDLLIIMQRTADLHTPALVQKIRKKTPNLPIIFLDHHSDSEGMNNISKASSLALYNHKFIWNGDSNLLLAMIKSVEDYQNVAHDTQFAGVRVIIFIESSSRYLSALLPLFYRELVIQTRAVMEEGLNEEHRLLMMRARPKILVAETYEAAMALYRKYRPYVLGIISDVCFPRRRRYDENAGVDLLKTIKKERFDIPLLLMSSDIHDARKAERIPAAFVDKNSPTLLSDVKSFFLNHLGFGDFVFRTSAGEEIARASNVKMLEYNMQCIPDESFVYHCNNNDFSRWLFARSELELASRMRPVKDDEFSNLESFRRFLVSIIHQRRMERQKGVIVDFDPRTFDEDTDFFKIGQGSLGGKARGLSFLSTLLRRYSYLQRKFPEVDIFIPQTMVVTTEVFETFVESNGLLELANNDLSDEDIAARFLEASFPDPVKEQLAGFLSQFSYPLVVRSSSLLEDAHYQAYAGLYKTYILPNDQADLASRLQQLMNAIKMVFASTYFQGPKSFSRRLGHRTEEEKIAVIIQKLVGGRYKNYFYPALSGVAQSHNYYPYAGMKPDEGVATIALGLGKTVMDGEKALRFAPQQPELLSQHSSIDDTLNNAQRFFYALKLSDPVVKLGVNDNITLAKREVSDAGDEEPVGALTSTYIPDDHTIRDFHVLPGYRVVTFARILKYGMFPLAGILNDLLRIAQEGMGCPVELEFCADLSFDQKTRSRFALLQLRPMSAREETATVNISAEDLAGAFCTSSQALGNGINHSIKDIVFVKPAAFDPGRTQEIAGQVGALNKALVKEGRRYFLIGPGRWGSADRWLGIPATWADVSGVAAIIETTHHKLNAESSQGSHFFHNIISLGINYLTVNQQQGDRIDWNWLTSLPIKEETSFVIHVSLPSAMTIKVDGRNSQGVLLYKDRSCSRSHQRSREI
jgi:CheY-like chemotaxis protein